jgi:hypothetical protein
LDISHLITENRLEETQAADKGGLEAGMFLVETGKGDFESCNGGGVYGAVPKVWCWRRGVSSQVGVIKLKNSITARTAVREECIVRVKKALGIPGSEKMGIPHNDRTRLEPYSAEAVKP